MTIFPRSDNFFYFYNFFEVAKGGPIKPPKPQSFTTTKKLAKTELEGNKWNIENHENNPMILIDQTEINQIINIFNVKNSVIQIKGKVNAVSLGMSISFLLSSFLFYPSSFTFLNHSRKP